MACSKCHEVQRYKRKDIDSLRSTKSRAYNNRAADCIHHANYCLVRLLSINAIALEEIAMATYWLMNHEGLFKHYLLKNKSMFTRVWLMFITATRNVHEPKRSVGFRHLKCFIPSSPLQTSISGTIFIRIKLIIQLTHCYINFFAFTFCAISHNAPLSYTKVT